MSAMAPLQRLQGRLLPLLLLVLCVPLLLAVSPALGQLQFSAPYLVGPSTAVCKDCNPGHRNASGYRRVCGNTLAHSDSVSRTYSDKNVQWAARFRRSRGAAQPAALKTDDAGTPRPRPNLMIFFADDLGWGDLACYGHPTSSTPRLDKLAAEGMRMTQFYAAAPECSPSRAGIITGRYPVRNGAYSNASNSHTTDPCGINNRNDSVPTCSDNVFSAQTGLPLTEKTLGDVLGAEGYRTAACGKWNLGETASHLPHRRGFNSYFGLPYTTIDCSSDINPRGSTPCLILHNGTVVEQGHRLSLRNTLDHMMSADVLRHAKAARDTNTPWLYYFASQHVHSPQFAPDDLLGSTDRGLFGDALAALDRSVGDVVDGFGGLGIVNDTLTVFTSDHGPAQADGRLGGSAGALKCGKGSNYEGGMRVPGIWHWPGHIRPGVSHMLASSLDILPTFAALAGGKLPAGLVLDGFDLSSALLNDAPSPRTEIFYYQGPLLTNVRVGWHKLRLWSVPGEAGDTACGPPDGRKVPWAIVPCWGPNWPDEDCWDTALMVDHRQEPLLFDLRDTPSETLPLDTSREVIEKIVAQAQAALTRHQAGMVMAEPAMVSTAPPLWKAACRTHAASHDVFEYSQDAPNDCCVPNLCQQAAGDGCCGGTDTHACGAPGAASGMFPGAHTNITSLAECLKHCQACESCKFLSWSAKRRDCSWYKECDLTRLTPVDNSYVSMAVNGTPPAQDPVLCMTRNVSLSNTLPILDTDGEPLPRGEIGVFLNSSLVRYGGCSWMDRDPRCRDGDFSVHMLAYFYFVRNNSIEIYRTDLLRFERVGSVVLRGELTKGAQIARPSLSYNPSAQSYVLRYSEIDSTGRHTHVAAAGASPTGPFAKKLESRLTCTGAAASSTFTDDDGTGYTVYAAGEIVCVERLDGEYVAGTGAVARIHAPTDAPGLAGPPVMFRRGGQYFVLFGRACESCASRTGPNTWVFTSGAALGSYEFRGDIGTAPGGGSVARAQQSAVFQVESAIRPENGNSNSLWVWLGNQWGSAEGLLSFYELEFDAKGGLLPLQHRAETSLLLAG